ncbi:hypothetical protein B7486_02005 [cyanobacterium TDX16]|nr:hypothetical protein B7486_02005 [cyanobacterium TDX16]
MRTGHRRRSGGFTLVELTTILVIVALVVGGILIGKDLYNAARNRSIIKELNSYQHAIALFNNKYSYYPGDLPNPQKYWPSATWTYNSYPNGDRAVLWAEEGEYAWRELRLANFVPEGIITNNPHIEVSLLQRLHAYPGTSVPESAVIPKAGWTLAISKYLQANMLLFGRRPPSLLGIFPSMGAISATDTFYIDSKLDDGDPQLGNIRVVLGGGGHSPYDATAGCVQADSTSHSGYVYQNTNTANTLTLGCNFYGAVEF